MSVIKYDIVTTNDLVEVNLYKTGTTDILISAHTITNAFGVENTFSYSDKIFENGTYKIITIDSLSATTEYNNIDVTCFAIEGWKFTIQTDASGAMNTSQFTLPTVSGYNYDATIDWGDGNQTPLTGHTDSNKTHTYSAPGTYQISISGLFEAFSFYYVDEAMKLISIDTPITIDQNLRYIKDGFSSCYNLKSICHDLFRYCTDITSFYATFFDCLILTTIPVDLFKYNINVTDFDYTFYGCNSIITTPVDLFKYNSNVTSFDSTFGNCGFESLTEDLFKYNINVTNFSGCFSGCNYLTYLPLNLFRYNINVTNFSGCFNTCNFTNIPTDLFRYNVNVTDFSYTFIACTQISTIPTDLFRYNTNATNFSSVFYGCISLTALPTDLFYYNNHVVDYSYTFNLCRNISLPTRMFNISNLSVVANWTNFMYVDNTTYSPTGTIQKIWSTTDTPAGDVAYIGTPTKTDAFQNCTAISNYASEIPTSWK